MPGDGTSLVGTAGEEGLGNSGSGGTCGIVGTKGTTCRTASINERPATTTGASARSLVFTSVVVI